MNKSTVAIQGLEGSFHHEAAEKLLGTPIEIKACDTFQQVFEAVETGTVAHGVVAIENNLYGSINAVYGLLGRQKVWVSGEVFLKIEQYLITGSAETDTKTIRSVRSQIMALAQCEAWLLEHLPDASLQETHDTTASVQQVVEQADPSLAAVAGKRAAELHGGHIIAGPINDDPHNYTRFFLLSKEQQSLPGANKTSIILETSHAPGALQRALQVFADASVNLSKLDSHPIAGDKWHYAFYLDFEAGLDTPVSQNILHALKGQGCQVTILGSYVGAELPSEG